MSPVGEDRHMGDKCTGESQVVLCLLNCRSGGTVPWIQGKLVVLYYTIWKEYSETICQTATSGSMNTQTNH